MPSPYVATIADYMTRAASARAQGARTVGAIQARGLEDRGHNTANLIAGVGGAVANTVGGIMQQKAEQQHQQQADAMARQFGQMLQAGATPADVLQAFPAGVGERFVALMPKPETPADYTLGNQRRSGKTNQVLATALPEPVKPPAPAQIDTVDDKGNPVTSFVLPEPGKSYPKPAPKADKPPAVGTFEDFLVQKYGARPTPDQITAARKEYQQADDRPSVTVKTDNDDAQNVKDAVAGMMDGTIPPQMPGRASKDYMAVMGEARRRGYDLAGAVTDWAATQKHIATMNGAQQLRLTQAINSLPTMLDDVESLAKQWKGGRFPILNRANLALAKGGAFGEDVASVANRLDAQIADVTADLGNVYMGGNSPTDHALGLAAKSLNGEWSQKVLLDMVGLARKNVQTRKNSINATGVAGASPDNPYAPQTPPPAGGKIRARDPQGVLHEAEPGTPLPAGWKLETN